MLKVFLYLLVILIFWGSTTESLFTEKWVDYTGYKVIRLEIETEKHQTFIKNLGNKEKYDFWSGPMTFLGSRVDIMIPDSDPIMEFILNKEIPHKIIIEDVGNLIQKEKDRMYKRQNPNMTWEDFNTLETINSWMDNLALTKPELVQVENYGVSTEGRDLRVLRISKENNSTRPKQAFWIDSTNHAREWASTATCTYIINQLVTNTSHYESLLEYIDFYFSPVLNPDGYAFTFSTNRLWRKTRSNPDNHTGTCVGVDNNRNFGFKFGGQGSSGDPCSETYRGPHAYSEPEAEALKNYILKKKEEGINWRAMITMHSYSQLWMAPYDYSGAEAELPEDFAELKALSDVAVAALTAVHGTTYITGNSAEILYPASGTWRDFAKAEGGFKFADTLELRDTGSYGFVMPPQYIIPTAEETWAGIQVVAKYLPH